VTVAPAAPRDQRGQSQSVQYAVILPVLMLSTLGVIQAGVWLHGRDVAVRAANGAADVARGSFGTAAEAEDLGAKLAAAGGLKNVRVTVVRSAGRADVTVSADPPLIFDVGLDRISETASVPVERVTQP
jgi:TadE-like protein